LGFLVCFLVREEAGWEASTLRHSSWCKNVTQSKQGKFSLEMEPAHCYEIFLFCVSNCRVSQTQNVTICVCTIAKISNFPFVTSVKRMPYTFRKFTVLSTYRTARELTQSQQAWKRNYIGYQKWGKGPFKLYHCVNFWLWQGLYRTTSKLCSVQLTNVHHLKSSNKLNNLSKMFYYNSTVNNQPFCKPEDVKGFLNFTRQLT